MPGAHALLSPSSAHRWMVCTAAPLYEAKFPPTTSKFAEEGTLAHSICELYVRHLIEEIDDTAFTDQLTRLQQEELYNPEMLETAQFYAAYIEALAEMLSPNDPRAVFLTPEDRVDLSRWIKGSFGTCDCVLFAGDTLQIVDYKHGSGVEVSAVGNPQMRLYALGALDKYQIIFGDDIKTVSMAIVQPRITTNVSTDSLSVSDLLAWGETVKAKAAEALSGKGVFVPGPEQCKFCRGKAVCRALADQMASLAAAAEEKPKESLTDDEIGTYLDKGEMLSDWYDALKDYARDLCLKGHTVTGYKVVEGRSNRAFADADKAFDALRKAGYDDAVLYDRTPKTLSTLEKMVGKKDFAKIMGKLVVKPKGKPTLVKESDKRDAWNQADIDFGDLAEEMKGKDD